MHLTRASPWLYSFVLYILGFCRFLCIESLVFLGLAIFSMQLQYLYKHLWLYTQSRACHLASFIAPRWRAIKVEVVFTLFPIHRIVWVKPFYDTGHGWIEELHHGRLIINF